MMFFLDAVIKSSLVLLVTFAAAWLLRRSSSATRHLVLGAGLTCSALSPALALVVPAWGLELQLPAPHVSSTAVDNLPVSAPAIPGSQQTSNNPAPAAAGPSSLPALTADGVVVLWAIGATLALFSLCAGFWRLNSIGRRADPVTHQGWLDALTHVAARHGLPRAPRLLQSRHPSLLVTWGVVRPTVLLPLSAPEWTPDRIRVVLDHELAHIVRRDWVVQVASQVLRCVYWFNPLVWAACRRLRQESEQACDDRVLAMGHAGTAYAAHLLDLARAFRSSDGWVPAAAIARPSSLERRVAAMLTSDVNRQPVSRRIALGAVLLLLLVTLPIASFDAFAQARFASVSGTVSDQEGGMLNTAIVALTNLDTTARYEVRTNRTGYYELAPLPAGRYELTAKSPAFAEFNEQVVLGVGESRQRNVTLSVSHLQETITVTASDDPVRIREVARPATRRSCADPTVGGCINPPVKVRDVAPLYPTALRERGIEGVVTLEATVDTEGRVKDLRVVSAPHPELEQLAADAVRAWEFTPTYLNGRPIDVHVNTVVRFGVATPTPSPRP